MTDKNKEHSSNSNENRDGSLILLQDSPPLCYKQHQEYIINLSKTLEGSFEGAVTQHLKASGVYWSLAAMSLLTPNFDQTMGLNTKRDDMDQSIVDWVLSCFDKKTGGFGGDPGHDGHLLYSLSAVQILAMADRIDLVPLQQLTNFIKSCQLHDGSFVGDKWGEVDTRFTYCALSCLTLLKQPLHTTIDLDGAVNYIMKCHNLDGGFGSCIGAESHAGQVFCCVGALSIAKRLHFILHDEKLTWWLAERQCDSGGLNGRSEKQADVCYSWWILSALSILGRMEWIDKTKLASFILRCQDGDDGGIADRPDDMPDVFHTFFGLSGLSLLGFLPQNTFRQIDPVFALPVDIVHKMQLQAQIISKNPSSHDIKHDSQTLSARYDTLERN